MTPVPGPGFSPAGPPVPPPVTMPPPMPPPQMPPPVPPPPTPPQPPAGGYSVPPQNIPPVGFSDPLVLAPGSSFGAWFTKVTEIAKRSWKSALIIATLGIAVPRAAVALAGSLGGLGTGLSVANLGGLGSAVGSLILGLLVTLLVGAVGCYIAAAGWAAGTWALVQEAATGRPANVGQAFGYGFTRATALFPWTLLAAVAFTVASACFFVPGIYVAFGFSMFGFAALFERSANPVARSFALTHNSATIGPTLGKVGILFGVYLVYTIIIGAIFGAMALAFALGTGGFAYNLSYGLIQAVASLLSAPAFAVLLIGLLPTYAELRARQAPLSTAQLQQELAG